MASKLHTTVSMHCHQWVRVLPTKLINARPAEWRDTFGHMPATQPVSRHCDPPQASYATKRPGTAGHPCNTESNGDRSFTSIQTVHTHTHPAKPGVQVSQLHNKVSRPYWKWTKWQASYTRRCPCTTTSGYGSCPLSWPMPDQRNGVTRSVTCQLHN